MSAWEMTAKICNQIPPFTWFFLAGSTVLSVPPLGDRISKTQRLDSGRSVRTHSWIIFAALSAGILLFLLLGKLSVAVCALIVVATAMHMVNMRKGIRQASAGDASMAQFLGSVTANLRAGSGIAVGMSRAVRALPPETPDALRQSLATAAVTAMRGGAWTSVLGKQSGQLRAIASLCALSERHGIALAKLFEQAQSRLDASRRHRTATQASLQGPKATALVLTCLPLAGLAMGTAMGASPLSLLFGGGLGGILLVVGTALSCGGLLWSNAIIAKASGRQPRRGIREAK